MSYSGPDHSPASPPTCPAIASSRRQKPIAILVFAVCLCCVSAQAGYTHYFTWNKKPSDAALTNCVNEMRLIINARKNMLVGPGETSNSPIVLDATHVDLNGIGDDAHEPFVFPGDQGFNFCKTEAKPYDAVVTACLMVARDHFPSSVLSIGSDGSWTAGDWQEGANLYTSVLNRPARNPIDGLGLGNGLVDRLWASFGIIVLFLALILFWYIKKKRRF